MCDNTATTYCTLSRLLKISYGKQVTKKHGCHCEVNRKHPNIFSELMCVPLSKLLASFSLDLCSNFKHFLHSPSFQVFHPNVNSSGPAQSTYLCAHPRARFKTSGKTPGQPCMWSRSDVAVTCRASLPC